MASEALKNLVVVSTGLELPPLMLELINAGLKFTLILNTTADFDLADSQIKDKDKEKELAEGVWYHHEIVKIANTIVPDDLTKSSLAKIFTKPVGETRIPLSDSEKFLVQWVSERQKAKQNFSDFFKALNEYAGVNINVLPLKFPENVATIKTQSSQVPLRYFQITGFIDRTADQKTDIEELQKQLVIKQEDKGKKKAKKNIEILGLDFGREILTEESKKEISEADAILLLAEDPCSLALLMLHKEFSKELKESKAPSTLICPTKFSFREQFILELLDVKPSLLGIAELGSGIVDRLVVGPEDAKEITDLRSKGFNVIMEDLSKIKDKKGLSSILKGVGISLKDISVTAEEEAEEKRTIEDLVTQLSYSKAEEPEIEEIEVSEDLERDVDEEFKPSEIDDLLSKETQPASVKLEDTEIKNFDFEDPSLKFPHDMVESLMKELSADVRTEESTTLVIDTEGLDPLSVIKNENDEKEEISIQFDSQEAFTEAIQTFLNAEPGSNNQELIHGIAEAITKNADMAAYAAKRLTAALEDQANPDLIPAYLEALKSRPLIFVKELLDWLFQDIGSPVFVSFAQRATIIVKMSKIDLQFTEELITEMVNFQITKSLPPKEREHIRTLVGMVTARDVTLQRRAIRGYLSHIEKGKKLDEIWLGLLKFDAALVGLEVIEFQTNVGQEIVQDAIARNLGSFGHIIYDVFNAYKKGDIQRVLAIAGTPSNGLLRKKKRVELAEKIKKFGTIPIETLADSVDIDPKELEKLVYEMINENEINAKIDVVEGRLTIVQLTDETENETG